MSDDYAEFQIELRAVKRDLALLEERQKNLKGRIDRQLRENATHE